jgi:hypothetical protein
VDELEEISEGHAKRVQIQILVGKPEGNKPLRRQEVGDR